MMCRKNPEMSQAHHNRDRTAALFKFGCLFSWIFLRPAKSLVYDTASAAEHLPAEHLRGVRDIRMCLCLPELQFHEVCFVRDVEARFHYAAAMENRIR